VTLGGAARRAAGWLFLILPLIPLRFIFDDPPGTTWLLGPYEWGLGLFVFGAAAWLACRLFPDLVERAAGGLTRLRKTPDDRVFRWTGLGALATLLFLTSTFAFSRSPLLIDSIIQLFQAKIFAGGAAWAPAPRYEAFFTTQHMLSDGGRWYSQYPPGHPGALALGVWIGAPWLVPLVLSLCTAWLIVSTTRRLFGESTARVTLLLLLLAPFFWFMGSSYMNHVSALFFVSLFFWAFVRWAEPAEPDAGRAPSSMSSPDEPIEPGRPAAIQLEEGDAAERRTDSLAWLLLAGVALGGAFLSRPLTAVAIGAAIAIPALRIASRRWLAAGVAGAAGFAVLASLYFVYNAMTTGDPLTPGYLKLWGEGHGLGFHATPWGDVHTPLTGLRNELVDVGLLESFLLEWPIPALLPLGLLLAAGWSRRRWEGRMLGAFFAIPAAYFFYWHRDAFLGPRYLYEGLPFLLPLLAVSFVELRQRLRGREIRWLGGLDAGTFFAALVGLSFAYSIGFGTPQRFRVYATGLESAKRDLPREARAAGIERGLIFVKVSWGNRLISRARGAGAAASVVERVYRSSDHCDMEQVVAAAEARNWVSDRVDQELLGILRPADEIEVVRLNEDPTLRLVPDRPLAAACAREVRYDQDGYTNFSPHLAANTPDLGGPLVFARDLRDQDGKLRALYPDLPAYLYWDGTFVELP